LVFKNIFAEHGIDVTILNPNIKLLDELSWDVEKPLANDKLSVRFISRYHIPNREIEALSEYLENKSPLTINALREHEVAPYFF
jgi:hypothetical protein